MFRGLPDRLAAFVEKRPLLCLFIVIVYVVSPVDVLPELALGPLGAFDDALVGIAALSLLKRAAKSRFGGRSAAKKADVIEAETLPLDRDDRDERRPPRDRDRNFDDRRPDRRPDGRRGDERRPDNRDRNDRDRNDRNRGGRDRDRDRNRGGGRDRRPDGRPFNDQRRPDDRRPDDQRRPEQRQPEDRGRGN